MCAVLYHGPRRLLLVAEVSKMASIYAVPFIFILMILRWLEKLPAVVSVVFFLMLCCPALLLMFWLTCLLNLDRFLLVGA